MEQVSVWYASSRQVSYGHHKVSVELNFNNDYKTFSAVTTDTEALDVASELEGEGKWNALYNIIKYHIEDEVNSWINNTEE